VNQTEGNTKRGRNLMLGLLFGSDLTPLRNALHERRKEQTQQKEERKDHGVPGLLGI